MKYVVSLGFLLMGVWVLWSGLSWPWGEHFEPLLLTMGVASCALVLWVSARMAILDEEGTPLQLLNSRTLSYLPWLIWAVVKANLGVARRILHPKLPIGPRLIRVSASQRSDVGQVIYANSITLTPGTVSVLVDSGTITVHALSNAAADDLESGEMDRRVAALENPD